MNISTVINLFAGLYVALLAPMSAFADVEINDTNFPDPNFRAYLLEQDYGQDGVITDEEIAGITYIGIIETNISSLEGIKYFTALTDLQCNDNGLTTLDVSGCITLRALWCHGNQLANLNVAGCTALADLKCTDNHLTTLNAIGCTALRSLDCDNNQLTMLNVSNCIALGWLYCNNNQLTTLDVSKNTILRDLTCYNNELTTIDVSGCTALDYLNCENNLLPTLDVSDCAVLRSLFCSGNKLTSLNVAGCTALGTLDCNGNQLTKLNVLGCNALRNLDCYNNQIQGANMDALISSLNNYEGSICIYDSYSETEGNICTKAQVAAMNKKDWKAFYWDGNAKLRYEGSNEPDGIIATEVDNGSEIRENTVAYDLNGRRVEGWQSKKGVYIVGDKKVMLK